MIERQALALDMKRNKKKRKTVLWAVIGSLIAVVGVGVLMFFAKKSKIKLFYDENGNVLEGSVAEKLFLDVNGSPNGMIIRGKNTGNAEDI